MGFVAGFLTGAFVMAVALPAFAVMLLKWVPSSHPDGD